MDEIKKILEARQKYFLALLIYLTGCIKKIPASISEGKIDDEIILFLKEILDYRETNLSIISVELLPTLLQIVDERARLYSRYLQMMLKNSDSSLYALNIWLKIQVDTFSETKSSRNQISNGSGLLPRQKAALAFDEHSTHKELQKKLEAQLNPDIIISLEKIIKPFRKKITVDLGMLVQHQLETGIKFCWREFFVDFYKPIEGVLIRSKKNIKQDEFTSRIIELFGANSAAIIQSIREKTAENTKKFEGGYSQGVSVEVEVIEKGVESYLMMLPDITIIENDIRRIENELHQNKIINKLREKYREQFAIVQKAKNELNAQIELLLTELNKLKANPADSIEAQELLTHLATIKTQVEQYAAKWTSEPLVEELDNVFITNEAQNAKKYKSEILDKQLKEITNYVHGLKARTVDRLEAAKNQRLKAQAELEKDRQAIENQMTEQRKLALIARRQFLEEQRTAAKNKPTIIHNIVKNATSSASNTTLSDYFDNALRKLSDKKLIELLTIVEAKRGITYHDVCTIIGNLGGTIEEIGNGGSHKRLRLDSEISEVYTHASTFKGSIVKPHGSTHNSGELSYFNRTQVSRFLNSCGITIIKIQSEQNLRLEQKCNQTNPLQNLGSEHDIADADDDIQTYQRGIR